MATATSNDSLATLLKLCSSFVLGFSTGHVGTTTISSASSYGNSSSVAHFFFEECTLSELLPLMRNENALPAQEHHVRTVWARHLVSKLSRRGAHTAGVCVDLSHYTLPFYRGLISVLQASGRPLSLVRIRRDACEVASSFFSSGSRFGACVAAVGFCPLHAAMVGSLVLSTGTTRAAWSNWTAFQKALWIADETEAQWLRRVVPGALGVIGAQTSILEVSWSSAGSAVDPPIRAALDPIARSLGLSAALPENIANKKQHVKGTLPVPVEFQRAQLLEYSKQLYRDYPESRSLQLPSHAALWRLHRLLPGELTSDADSAARSNLGT